MFNLITTLLICLGMSNSGMPISNYAEKNNESQVYLESPKKENENINTYTIQISMGDTTGAETSYMEELSVSYRKRPLTGNNQYLNIIGDYYQSEIKRANATSKHLIGNKNVLIQNGAYNGTISETKYPRSLYMLKITPYEYNIETKIRVRILAQVYGTTLNIDGTDYYSFDNLYINIRKYKCLDNAWDTYIHRQNTPFIPQTIETDIRNINNGYYYTYEEETLTYDGQASATSWNQDIVYNTEITITPQQNNYYAFVFEPLVDLSEQWYENNGLTSQYDRLNAMDFLWEETNQNWITRPYSSNPLQISGTNIIPSGTYEVVDIPGIMFDILGMPFTFISTAFNLTLFPNTPYQINISNLFLAIMALFIFIMLMRILVKAGAMMG